MINNAINSGLPTAVNKGGTAATNAADARTNLGIIAANIPITDSGGYYSTKNVEAALQQLGTGGQIISGLTQYGSVYASGVNSITSTGILGANQIVIGTGTVPSLKTLTNTASISWDTTSGLTATILPAGVDHNSLANLTTGDPHTQYLTTGRALTWLKTRSTQDLPESSSFLYYTDTRARTSISVTALGLDYNNSTGVISLDSLYTIPTTARTNIWQHASDVRVETWAAPFSYDIGIHQASLNYDSATLGINESNQLYSKVAGMTAIFADNPLSGLGTSGSHLIISQAGDSSDGYLNATDWNIFNNKEPALGNPTYDGYILSSSALGVRTWIAEPSTMVYPSAGIAVSTGTAWDTSIATDYFVHDLSAFTTDNLTQGSTNLYDQVVSLTEGTGIGISGTYPSFTISNTTPGTPPAGSDTQVQYNDGGTAFGASPNLTFDGETLSTTQILIPPGYGYGLSCSPLNFNGIDYVADMGSGLGTIFFNNDPNPNFITLANAPLLIRAIDGTADVNIGLITTDFGQGPAHLTVYTLFDLATLTYLVNNSLPSGSTLDAFFDNGVTTAGGLAQNGAGAAYTWNLPSGTTVVTGYNPTTLTDTIPLPSPFSVTGGVTSMNSPVLYGTMVDGGPGSSNYAGIQLTGRILGNKTGALDTSQGGSNRAATFSASPVMANDLNWQLPSADGSAGQAWVTDSHGNLGWSSFLTTETDPLSLHLDQSTPQEINGGTPNFNSGLNVNSGININGASQLTDSQLLTFRHGSGTDGLIQSSDQLINWQQSGWDGSGWGIGAWQIVNAKEDFSPNHHGSEYSLWVTPIGEGSPEKALVVNPDKTITLPHYLADGFVKFTGSTLDVDTNIYVQGTLDTDPTLGADSDSKVSSQKAIKAYINNTITYGISWQLPVADATLSTPPGSPTLNSRYVVAPTGLGAWATHDNEIATWNGASWDFVTPTAGWTVYSNADMDTYQFDGSVWFNIFTFSSGANTSLSNLMSVAINTSLLPGTDNSIDLGSPSYGWKDIHITGTATLTGMSSVGFVKNNASGVLSGGNSVSSGDVTGGLGYTPEYQLTFSSPLSRSTNTISIPAATASVDGYLNHTDWSTFNGKLGSLSGAFLLDQTAAQTVINGTPTFNLGITSNDKISINQTQTDVSNQGLNVNVTAHTTTNENTLNIANLIGIGNVVYTGKTNSGSSFGVYYENNSLAGFNGTLTNATAIGGGLLMSTAVGASAVITNGNGFSLAMEVDGGTMTNANSLYVNNFNTGGGTVTNYRGFNFGSAFPVTANGQSRYGIYFGSAMPNPGSYTGTTVQAIHLYAGTTSSDGINWGTDTSIYRSAANTLTTGNFIVGGTLLLSNYTTNGFVKFTGSNGTLGVDTNSYEPALGNPTTNGYVLSSTTAGVRSWVASGVPTRGNLTEATSSILTITGGTNAVLGTGTSIQVKQANTTTSGYLSSTDWNTFNGKQAAGAYLTAVTVNAPLTGAGTAASHLSIPVATASANGYLSSTDWTTFNGKQSALTFSTGLTNTAGTVTVSAVQNITRLSNLTTNALVKTTTANGTLAAAVAGDVDSVLPTQTGNSGKYLTTNGTNSSWGTVTTVTIARKHGAVSQTVALGTSALNITHGLGTAPTWVKIAANYNFGLNSFSHSNGEYSGSTYSCVYDGYGQVNNIDTSNIIYLKTAYGATYIIVSATVTLTSTQIQLSFSNTTNSGVTSAIINLQWECGT